MPNWKMWKWLTPMPKPPAVIEVEGEVFNPTRELIDVYKRQLAQADKRVEELERENGLLRNENLLLKERGIPAPEVKITKHFTTVSQLKSELEARSREQKKRENEEKSITTAS